MNALHLVVILRHPHIFVAAKKENNPLIMRFAYTRAMYNVYTRKNPLIEITFVRFRWQWSGAHTWLALCNFQTFTWNSAISNWIMSFSSTQQQQTTQLMTCIVRWSVHVGDVLFCVQNAWQFLAATSVFVAAAVAGVCVWKMKELQNWFDYNEQMNKVLSINFICKRLLYTWKCVCVCVS